MATRKSTRAIPGGTRSSERASAVARRARSRAEARGSSERPAATAESLRQLTLITLRLRAVYGTALAAELALRQQAAEQDPEIADCLRAGVCNPIADQIVNLDDLTHRFRSGVPEFNT